MNSVQRYSSRFWESRRMSRRESKDTSSKGRQQWQRFVSEHKQRHQLEVRDNKGLCQSTKKDISLRLETEQRFVLEHKQRHQLEIRDRTRFVSEHKQRHQLEVRDRTKVCVRAQTKDSLRLETEERFVSEHKKRHQLEVRDNKVCVGAQTKTPARG